MPDRQMLSTLSFTKSFQNQLSDSFFFSSTRTLNGVSVKTCSKGVNLRCASNKQYNVLTFVLGRKMSTSSPKPKRCSFNWISSSSSNNPGSPTTLWVTGGLYTSSSRTYSCFTHVNVKTTEKLKKIISPQPNPKLSSPYICQAGHWGQYTQGDFHQNWRS